MCCNPIRINNGARLVKILNLLLHTKASVISALIFNFFFFFLGGGGGGGGGGNGKLALTSKVVGLNLIQSIMREVLGLISTNLFT